MEQFMKDMPKLGFGLMRLPRIDGAMDIEQIKDMVDAFFEAGMRYFDTAYVYDGSEETTKIVLCDRYPRDSYYLTTKLNASQMAAKTREDAIKEIEISLERTGAGYFDFYLLHAISDDNVHYYNEYGLWDYVKELKEKGFIKHYGFSFHGTPELLDNLLTDHPDVEVVQLQINYADWENENIQSRKCHEVCVKHDKPIVIMEPVKGGSLADPVDEVKKIFKEYNPDASAASWAIRYAASLPNVMVVLSGMSNREQMNDNLSYMRDFKPLNEEEKEVIEKVREAMANIESIPCTKCKYCVEGCPMQIDIPSIFSAMNLNLIYNNLSRAKQTYERVIKDHGKASECVHCLQCEAACPQHIQITSWLEKASEVLE